MPSRDWDILDNARDLLLATQEFDNVYRSSLPETRGQASGDRHVAVITFNDWEETDESDDPTSVQTLRKVRWNLTLIVREDDAETRERELDRLLCVAQNTLDGKSLLNLTINDWTKLRRGSYAKPEPPSQTMSVMGEFAYWLEGFAGHDLTAF